MGSVTSLLVMKSGLVVMASVFLSAITVSAPVASMLESGVSGKLVENVAGSVKMGAVDEWKWHMCWCLN